MLVDSDQCEYSGLENMRCVWVESETIGCKTKTESCEEIKDSEEWCETEGALEDGESRCIWIERNDDTNEGGNCMDEVYY
jgi:hypothetical protein